MMAALIVATAAKPGFGSRAALPEISTTEPFEAFSASQARIVRRRAPCSLSAMPSSHCASVISNKSICGTAPAIFSSASILPKRSSVDWTRLSTDQGSRKSSAQISVSAPAASTSPAVFLSSSSCLAVRTTASKSRASRLAVARPMPWLAPVTIATDLSGMTHFRFGGERLPCRFQNYSDNKIGRRVHGAVINGERPNFRAHALCHEALRLRRNHPIFFRQQKPRWLRFPQGRRTLLLDALQCDRPLHGLHNRGLAG